LVANDGACGSRKIAGAVRGAVVVDVNGAVGQRGTKVRDDARDGCRLVATRHQDGDTPMHGAQWNVSVALPLVVDAARTTPTPRNRKSRTRRSTRTARSAAATTRARRTSRTGRSRRTARSSSS